MPGLDMPPGLGQVLNSTFSHCGSLLAAARDGQQGVTVDVTLYDMMTMRVLKRATADASTPGPFDVFIFSPDGKRLIFDVGPSEIMVFQVHALDIRSRFGEDTDVPMPTSVIAFDPTSQCGASAGLDYCVRLWTL
jgi:hypothetical protein